MSLPNTVVAVIRARTRSLGGVRVRRVLPSRARQRIGPFIFLDHLGPERLAAGRGIDVAPHPHIGLATVTYLFEGDLVHRDSLGIVETIRPGDINWMHAGQGVVHSERTGPEERRRESSIHGLQLWTALPSDDEGTPPEFSHYTADCLPRWAGAGLAVRVLVGEAFGHASPVRTRSRTLYLDVLMDPGSRLEVPDSMERAAYVVDGAVSCGSTNGGSGDLIVLPPETGTVLAAHSRSRLVVLGGDTLDGDRYIRWNFVSSFPDRIAKAEKDWADDRFPPVPGEEEREPMPS